jgi:hypothetical protein
MATFFDPMDSCSHLAVFDKKTRMKSTSHHSKENFAFQIQFPFVCSIAGSFQNFL